MATIDNSMVKKKKRMIVSYKNLTFEQLALLKSMYPQGFMEAMMKVKGINNEEFNAVMMETDDIQYLVKVETGSTGVIFDDEETTDTIVEDASKGLIPEIENDSVEEEEDNFEEDNPEDDDEEDNEE